MIRIKCPTITDNDPREDTHADRRTRTTILGSAPLPDEFMEGKGFAARPKKFWCEPRRAFECESVSRFGGTPVGYASFRKGAPSRKLFLFLMWLVGISGAALGARAKTNAACCSQAATGLTAPPAGGR